MTQTRPPGDLTPSRRRAVLGVMCLALMMVVAAVASLNVALPDLARDTGATQSRAAVDRRRLRARLRRPAAAGGRARRPLRAQGHPAHRPRRLRRRVARGDLRRRPIDADRAARRDRRRRRARDADDAVDHHERVPARGARPRGRHLGRRRRRRGDHRPAAVRGDPARVVLVAGGVRHQRGAGRGRDRATDPDRADLTRARERVRLDPVGALLSSLGLFALVFAIIEAPQRAGSTRSR